MKYLTLIAFVGFTTLGTAQTKVQSANTDAKTGVTKVHSPITKVVKTDETKTVETDGPKINWMTWDEAFAANEKNPKKIFVDIYTDWCGWCKKMDKSTFVDPTVVEQMNDEFYAIKFDAEQKDDIQFNGATFSYVGQGRRGSHQLAYALLDGRMSYPSFVLLDEKFQRIMLAPGFKTPEKLMPQLKYTSSEAYKKQNFEDFSKADD